jgi:hypothetical protein
MVQRRGTVPWRRIYEFLSWKEGEIMVHHTSGTVSVRYGDESGQNPTLLEIHAEATERAVGLFKQLWSESEVEERLAEVIENSDEYFRDIVTASHGKFRTSTVEVRVDGLSGTDFTTWWNGYEFNNAAFIDLHPEHYSCRTIENSSGPSLEFVERLWGHVCRVYVDVLDAPQRQVGDDHILVHAGRLRLEDSTVLGESLHRYYEIGDDVLLGRYEVQVPVALPTNLQAESERHLVYEVTRWFEMAKNAAKMSEVRA